MKWFKKKLSLATAIMLLCTSIFFISGNLAYAEPIDDLEGLDTGSLDVSGIDDSSGVDDVDTEGDHDGDPAPGDEGEGNDSEPVGTRLTFNSYDDASHFISFYYATSPDFDIASNWHRIDPVSNPSPFTNVFAIKWAYDNEPPAPYELTTFTISPSNGDQSDIFDTLKQGPGSIATLDPQYSYAVTSVVFTQHTGDNGDNPPPGGGPVTEGKVQINLDKQGHYNAPRIHWSDSEENLNYGVAIDISESGRTLNISLREEETQYLRRLQVNWRKSDGAWGEDNTYEQTLWDHANVDIPLTADKEWTINIILSNTKNVGWAYPDNPGRASEDQMVYNAKLYLLEAHGDQPIDPNRTAVGSDNGTSHDLVIGETYYFKLVPDYGYQVAGLKINGVVTLTPIAGNDNMGIFKFTMVNTNFHFKGLVTPSEDEYEIESNKVSGASIADAQNATDSGNVRLTVKDTDLDSAAAKTVDGATPMGTVELDLDKIVSKGENNGYWESPITEFENPVSVSLQLPADALSANETYSVVRNHNGEYEELDAEYDAESGNLTFDTNRFSEYTLIKKATEVASNNKSNSSAQEEENKTPSTETLELIKKEQEAANTAATTLPIVPQEDIAVTLDGTVIDTWEDLNTLIASSSATDVPKLTQIVVGNKDTSLPASTFKTLSKSKSTGLHLFLGESTALTFVNDKKLKKQPEVDLSCTTTKSDNVVEIAFTNKTKLKATVIIHSAVPATAKDVELYKISAKGKKKLVAKLTPNVYGNVCYPIKELATYRIEYK